MKTRRFDEFQERRFRRGKKISVQKRIYTFGILTAIEKDIFRSRYQTELLSGIFQRAAMLHHEIKIFTLSEKPCRSLDAILQEHSLDGLFVLTWRWIRPEVARLIETSRHDRVLVFNDAFPGLRVNNIYTDTDEGMTQAITHLVKEGRRKIGMLHGPMFVSFKSGSKKILIPFIDTRLKKEGFLRSLKSNRIPVNKKWMRSGNANTELEGYHVMGKWLREKNLPEAILCGNDDLAFGALKALTKAGLHVPQDIAVIGFDDHERAQSFSPPLTTIRQPLSRMGKDAVDILIRQIECPNPRPVSRRYLPELIVRKTA